MCKNFTIPVGNDCNLRVLLLQPDGYVVDLSAADDVHAYIGDKYKMIEVEEAEINGNSLIVPLHAEQKAGRYDFKLTAIIEGRNISACAHEMIIRSTYGEAAPAEIVVVMHEHSAKFYHGYVAGENIKIEGDKISSTGGGDIPEDLEERLEEIESGVGSNKDRIDAIEGSVLDLSSILDTDPDETEHEWIPMPKIITYAGSPTHSGLCFMKNGTNYLVVCVGAHGFEHKERGEHMMYVVFDIKIEDSSSMFIRYKRYYYDSYGEPEQVAPLYIRKAVHPDARVLDLAYIDKSEWHAVPEVYSFYGMGAHSGFVYAADKEGNELFGIVACPLYHSYMGLENRYIIFDLSDGMSDEKCIKYNSGLQEHEAPYYIRRAVHEAEMFDFTKDIHVFDEMAKIQMPKGFCYAGLPVVNGLGQDSEGNTKLVVAENPSRDLRDGTSPSIYTFDIVNEYPIIYISNPHQYSGDERERWMLIALGEWRPE